MLEAEAWPELQPLKFPQAFWWSLAVVSVVSAKWLDEEHLKRFLTMPRGLQVLGPLLRHMHYVARWPAADSAAQAARLSPALLHYCLAGGAQQAAKQQDVARLFLQPLRFASTAASSNGSLEFHHTGESATVQSPSSAPTREQPGGGHSEGGAQARERILQAALMRVAC